MRYFNVILASSRNNCIGNDNKLPWFFEKDMKHFNNMTKSNNIFNHNNILIMGRRTWESIDKKVLSNRINYVITSQEFTDNPQLHNTLFFNNFYSAFVKASATKGDIWVIGGSKIYDEALRFWACDKIYHTDIDGDFEGNVFFDITKYSINWTDKIEYRDINKNDNTEYNLTFRVGTMEHGIETQYLHTLHNVLMTGEMRKTRNGTTFSKFSKTLKWNLQEGFPLLTTKKMFWKGIVEELLFFIRGHTNTKELSNKGIKIWEPNTNREFLDKMGFVNYNEGEMGPMYGYQWRNFNGSGFDQLKKLIHEIKTDPHSRRLLMTDFNPLQAHLGVLYPCHSIVLQFYVENGKLSCSMYQRSGDLFLGIPFNIASTSLLTVIIAQLTGLTPYNVNLVLGDYHIYKEHEEAVLTQLVRKPYDLPKLIIKPFETLEQVEKSTHEDYIIIDYHCHNVIKAKMIA